MDGKKGDIVSYPYDKTYLEKIQENKTECENIENAYHVLLRKFLSETRRDDVTDLSIREQFALLGEAFEYASSTLDGITDGYHFMWDVIEALLTSDEEKNAN